jgi:phenylacetate-CoA ligase
VVNPASRGIHHIAHKKSLLGRSPVYMTFEDVGGGKDLLMRIGYGLKKLHDFATAGMILRKLTAHDRWTRQDLLRFQQQRLASLVTYAIRHSPFYRELYGNIKMGGQLVLNELPIIDKATMMEHFDRVSTDPRLKLAELQAHISQLTRDEYYQGQYRVLTTSGSSGVKGLFIFNRKEWSTILAGRFRNAIMMGASARFPKRLRMACIGADTPRHVSHRMAEASDMGHVKMQRLHATSSIEHLVDALNAFQPDYLTTYPSIASLLAIEQLEGNLDIHPQIVETGAEMRTEEMGANIRKAWGVTPFNVYGTTETGAINVDCPFHRGIHLFEDLWIAEIVDEQNQPVPDGSPGHKVLLTNLFNFTQPLIRYEVSDMLTISPEPCPCGRPFRLIARIEGRSDDIVYLRSPQGPDVPVHPLHFHSVIGALQEIKEYRVVHEADRIGISIVLRAGVSEEGVAGKLTEDLRINFESLGAECPDIQVRFVNRIERDPSTMGKLKLVESKVSGKPA